MRSAAFVAFLVTSSAFLAGCSGNGGGDDDTYTCPDGTTLDLTTYSDRDNSTFSPASKCPKASTTGTGSRTNTTSLPPNRLPVLNLQITDGQNATNVTLLDGNLTFDATGSTDPDGTITGIAVTVQDSNSTRTATLYDAARRTFQPATFRFDRPGIVNVTVAMVDDRAGFTVNQTHVYVNELIVGTRQTIQFPNPGVIASECGTSNEIAGAQFYKPSSFNVVNGATFIEAMATTESETVAGTAELTICGPDGEPLGEPGNPAYSTGGPFAAAPGIQSYYVGITIEGGATTDVFPVVLVHYEPGATPTFV